MKRTIVALAVAALLTCGAAARGQYEKFDPAAKKLMPKDQLEIVERLEALAEKHRTLLFRIKDAKKRGEENERLAAETRVIQEALTKKLQTEGLTGWVGVCHIVMPNNAVILDSWQPLHLDMRLSDKGKSAGPAEDALRSIKPNDIVRFSTKADPTYTVPRALGKGWGAVGQPIKVTSLTSVEKVGTRQLAPAAKAPSSGRKKP
jgi:hypothetical protein